MSDRERISLDRLGPEIDPERWEALVRSIVRAAGPELERLRTSPGVLQMVERWRRPVLSFSVGLAAAALATLLLVDGGASSAQAAEEPVFAEAVMPTAVAGWFADAYEPDPITLLVALEEAAR